MADGGGITRRDAVRIAALLGFCGAWPYAANAIGPGLPRRGEHQSIYQAEYPLMDPTGMVMTTCAGCQGGCPLKAQREVGILAKVDGNPFSPRQHGDPMPRDLAHAAQLRGATCARGQARVQNVHDPYRIVKVLEREGARGSGRYRTVAAEDALAALMEGSAGRPGLEAKRQATLGAPPGEAPRLLIAIDPRHQDRRAAVAAFVAAWSGSAALLGHPAPAAALASREVLGHDGWLATPRWDRAKALIAWGADPVASGLDPVGASWWIADARAHGATTVVAVDPRLSDTAAMADLWVPVRPGGDRALAHWVARILAEEGWIDPAKVPREIRTRPVRQLEHRTGLGAKIVHRLAEVIGEARTSVGIAIGGGVADAPGGPATATAILHLAALMGALDHDGAMEPSADPVAAVDGPRALAEALTGPNRPDALILVGDAGVQDTVYERPVLRALAEEDGAPLVVAFTTAMNRLSWHADYIVPDVTEFERAGLVERHDGTSVVLPALPAVPEAAGLPGALGRGLEGWLQAFLDRAGIAARLEDATWGAIGRAAHLAAAPALGVEDAPVLAEALQERVPESALADAAAASLLARGWVPPAGGAKAPPPGRWLPGESAAAEPAPPEGPVLVTFKESFGGQPDSDAHSWGARAVRQDNPLHINPERIEQIEGHHSDQVHVGEEIARVKRTSAIRADCVALAVGYGQRHGFDGAMTIDGEAVPAAPTRCVGVPVGPLLAPERTIAVSWAEGRRDPSIWDLLRPGGWQQLPSVERKHHEDV